MRNSKKLRFLQIPAFRGISSELLSREAHERDHGTSESCHVLLQILEALVLSHREDELSLEDQDPW